MIWKAVEYGFLRWCGMKRYIALLRGINMRKRTGGRKLQVPVLESLSQLEQPIL